MTSVRDIAERLVDDAESVARELLPHGKKQGGEWCASGSRSPLGQAISVNLRGQKRGVVLFTGGTSRGKIGGDLLDLAAEIYGSKRAGIEWAKGYLGLSDDRPEQSEESRRRAEAKRRERERQDAQARARKSLRAIDIWRAGVSIRGTPAEAYLLKRGLAPCAWPQSLRYAASVEYELGRLRDDHGAWTAGPLLPALVAAVQNVSRQVVAVWRVFLTPEGDKAPLDPCKVGLGPAKGGAVRFGPAAHTIGVAEGIETALALRELVVDSFPIWAALSTSGMQTLELPPEVKEVRIFPDSDLPSKNKITGEDGPPPGMRAARALYERVIASGRRAVIEESPSLPKTDFLDIAAAVKSA